MCRLAQTKAVYLADSGRQNGMANTPAFDGVQDRAEVNEDAVDVDDVVDIRTGHFDEPVNWSGFQAT